MIEKTTYEKTMQELQSLFDKLTPEQKEKFIRDFEANFIKMAREAIREELMKRVEEGRLKIKNS